MTTAARKLPPLMTVEEFHAWPGNGTGTRYELVDGQLRAMAPASDVHGTIHSNIAFATTAHLRVAQPGCRLIVAPGIEPRTRSTWNHRTPELGVTCAPSRPGQIMMPDPILLIEVLSPGNAADTWSNVPLYATVPTVQEILIVSTTRIGAELLRRDGSGHWPKDPTPVGPGKSVELQSIGLNIPLHDLYRDTHLAQPEDGA